MEIDYEISIIAYYSRAYQDGIDAFKKLFNCKTIAKNTIASIFKNFGYYERFIKSSELQEINELKQKFINYYLKPKVVKPKVSEKLKKKFKKNLNKKKKLKE